MEEGDYIALESLEGNIRIDPETGWIQSRTEGGWKNTTLMVDPETGVIKEQSGQADAYVSATAANAPAMGSSLHYGPSIWSKKSNNILSGVLGGAAVGFLVAGPAGSVAGGIMGGLFGSPGAERIGLALHKALRESRRGGHEDAE